MSAVVVWCLVALGVIYFITESAVFSPVRRLVLARVFGPFTYCRSCVGFWVGLGLWCVAVPIPLSGWPPGPHGAALGIASGFAGSALGTVFTKLFPHNDAYSVEQTEVPDGDSSE